MFFCVPNSKIILFCYAQWVFRFVTILKWPIIAEHCLIVALNRIFITSVLFSKLCLLVKSTISFFFSSIKRKCSLSIQSLHLSFLISVSYLILEKTCDQIPRFNPFMMERYIFFTEKYISMGHMSTITSSLFKCYLPHHGVLKGVLLPSFG